MSSIRHRRGRHQRSTKSKLIVSLNVLREEPYYLSHSLLYTSHHHANDTAEDNGCTRKHLPLPADGILVVVLWRFLLIFLVGWCCCFFCFFFKRVKVKTLSARSQPLQRSDTASSAEALSSNSSLEIKSLQIRRLSRRLPTADCSDETLRFEKYDSAQSHQMFTEDYLTFRKKD